MRDLIGLGQAAEAVLGHCLRHRQRALDKLRQHLGRAVARRHHRLSLPDEDAQPEIPALRALELFGLAEAAGMRERDPFDDDGVSCVGAGLFGARDEIL